MASEPTHPEFAGRDSPETVEAQAREVAARGLPPRVLDAVDDAVVLLNARRQVLLFNRAGVLDSGKAGSLQGLRLGEVWACIHRNETLAGCSTAKSCEACGAAQAVAGSGPGQETREACIINDAGQERRLLVKAAPFELGNMRITCVAWRDVTAHRRRRALERAFFHDVLNSVSGLRIICSMLPEDSPGPGRIFHQVRSFADRLADDISAQRDLMAGENNELTVHFSLLHSRSLLAELLEGHRRAGLPVKLRLHPAAEETEIISDRRLLSRVLGNMIRNAIDAAEPGQTITSGCNRVRDGVLFWTHNPTEVPPEVRPCVFQFGTTTKDGYGHGVGTYSMKLLTERYLHGWVDFSSNSKDGTIFRVWCPLDASSRRSARSDG